MNPWLSHEPILLNIFTSDHHTVSWSTRNVLWTFADTTVRSIINKDEDQESEGKDQMSKAQSHALKQLDFPPQNNGILWVFTAGNRNGEELGCSLWATCVMQMWKKNLKKEREREKHALTHKMRYSQRKYRSINVSLLRPTPCARFVHSFTRKINSNQNRQNLVEHNFWGGNKLLIKQTLRGDRIVSQTQNKV